MEDLIMTALEEYISTKILKQPGRKIGTDEALISSGMIDSFSLVDLALFVEDTYNVRIDDAELNAETFNNLNELSALIESRRKK